MKRTVCILAIAALMMACESYSLVNPVPNFPVNLEVNILAEFPGFTPANTYSYITFPSPRYATERTGYAGVMVYIAGDMTYRAFDLGCPHCLDQNMPIVPDDNRYEPRKQGSSMYARCPKCGEEYDLSMGTGVPTKGIAQNYLKSYQVITGNGKLIIHN